MADRFWETEKPQIVEGKWLQLEYYPENGKLCLIKRIVRGGETRYRRLTLDRRDFRDLEVARLLETVVRDWTIQNKLEGDDTNAVK